MHSQPRTPIASRPLSTQAHCYDDIEVALHPLTEMWRSPRPATVRPLADLLDRLTSNQLVEYIVDILAGTGSTEFDRVTDR